MKTSNIQVQFRLSPAAFRVLSWVPDKQQFALVIEVFRDAILYGDICDFCEPPEFYFDEYGRQKVKRKRGRFAFKKTSRLVDLHTLKHIKSLKRYGFNQSWIIEEALFYAYKKKLIHPLRQAAA